jgi:uncharacterized protein HemY
MALQQSHSVDCQNRNDAESLKVGFKNMTKKVQSKPEMRLAHALSREEVGHTSTAMQGFAMTNGIMQYM